MEIVIPPLPAEDRSQPLEGWLDKLERRHPRSIDLGLERVGAVWQALGAPDPARRVIAVGGTNGKGSTVAFAEAAAQALGWRVGAYTSPHLIRYNERIRVAGTEAGDEAIVAAFERIEAVRGATSLTYFEFGTLAALLVMAQASPALDLALLEVGLGGRLDAVNIIDADVSVVTTVALDHQEWLGGTRAAIAREKAGIARPGRPLIVGERDVEPALIDSARVLSADIRRLGVDFDWHVQDGRREFRFGADAIAALPSRLPLSAPCQWDNAAAALAALASVAGVEPRAMSGADVESRSAGRAVLDFDLDAAAQGLVQARLAGRLQRLRESPEVVVDVGHNPQAAQVLAQWLATQGSEKTTVAVFSALSDKDIVGIVEPLMPYVRHWYLAGLAGTTPRGLTVEVLAERLSPQLTAAFAPAGSTTSARPERGVSLHATVADALAVAQANAMPDERVLAFGSFYVVAEAVEALRMGS